jgi:hypothetical protein
MPGFYLLKADAKFDEIDRAIVNEFSGVCGGAALLNQSVCV